MLQFATRNHTLMVEAAHRSRLVLGGVFRGLQRTQSAHFQKIGGSWLNHLAAMPSQHSRRALAADKRVPSLASLGKFPTPGSLLSQECHSSAILKTPVVPTLVFGFDSTAAKCEALFIKQFQHPHEAVALKVYLTAKHGCIAVTPCSVNRSYCFIHGRIFDQVRLLLLNFVVSPKSLGTGLPWVLSNQQTLRWHLSRTQRRLNIHGRCQVQIATDKFKACAVES